jgi:ElaB protein
LKSFHGTAFAEYELPKTEVHMAELHQPNTTGAAGTLQKDSSAGKAGGGEGGNVSDIRSDLRDKIENAQEVLKAKYRVVSESTDDFVHESPWKSVAMALLGGLIIGLLAAR